MRAKRVLQKTCFICKSSSDPLGATENDGNGTDHCGLGVTYINRSYVLRDCPRPVKLYYHMLISILTIQGDSLRDTRILKEQTGSLVEEKPVVCRRDY